MISFGDESLVEMRLNWSLGDGLLESTHCSGGPGPHQHMLLQFLKTDSGEFATTIIATQKADNEWVIDEVPTQEAIIETHIEDLTQKLANYGITIGGTRLISPEEFEEAQSHKLPNHPGMYL